MAAPRWGGGGSLGVSGPPACMLKQRNLDPGEQGTAQMEERSILNTHPGSRRSWGNSRGRRRNKRRERTALDKEESFLRRNAKSEERGSKSTGSSQGRDRLGGQPAARLPPAGRCVGPSQVWQKCCSESSEETPGLALSPTSPHHPPSPIFICLELSFCIHRTKA